MISKKSGDIMSPWQQFLKNIINLVEIKAILTLIIIVSFCFKTLQGVELTSEYVMMATAIVTYYFSNGRSKDKENKNIKQE